MTVKEMHIGVDAILQKVNSNFTDSFEAPQIDWALNEEVIRFIKQRLNPQLNNQKRFDDLKPLITSAKDLPCFINDENSVFTYLPALYLFLINDRTKTKDLCGTSFSKVVTESYNFFITKIKINDDDIDLYSTLKIYINGYLRYDITNYPGLVAELPSSEAKFVLINHIIEILNTNGFPCKYDSYFGVSENNSIIIYTFYNINGIDIVYNSGTINYTSSLFILNKIKTISGAKEYPNRLTNTEDLYPLLDSSLGSTLVYTPISTLEEDKLIVFHNKKFIPSSININFIKKPKKISLSLNQNCELDEPALKEIVENTAKRLAGLTNSQIYDKISNENLGKE